jgi:hypothetical protein
VARQEKKGSCTGNAVDPRIVDDFIREGTQLPFELNRVSTNHLKAEGNAIHRHHNMWSPPLLTTHRLPFDDVAQIATSPTSILAKLVQG